MQPHYLACIIVWQETHKSKGNNMTDLYTQVSFNTVKIKECQHGKNDLIKLHGFQNNPPSLLPPYLMLLGLKHLFPADHMLTSCSGTRFWPACRSGWERLPAPSCPAHSDTSDAQNCAPAGRADGQRRRSALSVASSGEPAGCLCCSRSPCLPPLSLKHHIERKATD